MRRMIVETLALALVLAGASIGMGQPATPQATDSNAAAPAQPKPAPAKSKLEEMLAEALKNNPDIRVAVAKVAEADAELNRTRLQVTQKVIALHHALLSQKAAVDYEQKKFERMKQLLARAAIDTATLDEAQQALTLAKAKLAELEAQMPALLGKADQAVERHLLLDNPRFYPLVGEATLRLMDGKLVLVKPPLPRAAGPMADKIRKALETPVRVDYKDAKLSEIFKDLQKKAPGLSFRDISSHGGHSRTLQFEEALPVAAILQALGDYFELTFVVREYGILVTEPKAAPPGALTVQEFLRQKPAEK